MRTESKLSEESTPPFHAEHRQRFYTRPRAISPAELARTSSGAFSSCFTDEETEAREVKLYNQGHPARKGQRWNWTLGLFESCVGG